MQAVTSDWLGHVLRHQAAVHRDLNDISLFSKIWKGLFFLACPNMLILGVYTYQCFQREVGL